MSLIRLSLHYRRKKGSGIGGGGVGKWGEARKGKVGGSVCCTVFLYSAHEYTINLLINIIGVFMFILDRINREFQSLNRLELKFGLS